MIPRITPTRAGLAARRLLVGLALLLPALLVACGKEVATLTLGAITREPRQQETALSLREGTGVGFGIRVARYTSRKGNSVILSAELLRAGAVVGSLSCDDLLVIDPHLRGGFSVGASSYRSSCSLPVPQGGADRIRVRAWLGNRNPAIVEGFEVQVRAGVIGPWSFRR